MNSSAAGRALCAARGAPSGQVLDRSEELAQVCHAFQALRLQPPALGLHHADRPQPLLQNAHQLTLLQAHVARRRLHYAAQPRNEKTSTGMTASAIRANFQLSENITSSIPTIVNPFTTLWELTPAHPLRFRSRSCRIWGSALCALVQATRLTRAACQSA